MSVSKSHAHSVFEKATIFPLWPIVQTDKGPRCGCGNPACEAIGKHPSVLWKDLAPGQKVDGPDGCGYGMATGRKSGLYVADEDVIGSWMTWLINKGEMVDPATFTVETPRPGRHYYHTIPEDYTGPLPNTVSELAPGIDTRGDGGYIVLPGSPHVNGKAYKILEDLEPGPMPEALLAWIAARGTSDGGTAQGRPVGVLGEPPEDVTAALVEVISVHWPDVTARHERHPTQRALAGALVHSGYAVSWIVDVLTRIGGDAPKRQRTVAATVAAYEAGDPTEGWPALARRIPTEAAQAVLHGWLDTQLNLGPTDTAIKAAEVRALAPVHRYSYAFNEVRTSSDDPKKADYGALFWTLTTDDDWHLVFSYDTLRGQVVATRPPMPLDAEQMGHDLTDDDLTKIAGWLSVRKALIAEPKAISRAVRVIARQRSFSPLVRYLDSLASDGTDAIGELCERLCREPESIYRTMVRKTLIASVARAYRPGAKVDTCLVLQGAQNAGKSATTKALWGEEYHRAVTFTPNAAEMTRLTRGAWVAEMDELDGIGKADQRSVKAWLSRDVDTHVRKFEENAGPVRRGFVCVGTSNDDELLSDPTGERRWWIVPTLDDVDHEWIKANRDRIWGQAKSLYLSGEPWHLTDAADRKAQAEVAKDHKVVDPIEKAVTDYLAKTKETQHNPVDVACVVYGRAGYGPANPGEVTHARQIAVGKALKALGYVKHRNRETGYFWEKGVT